MGVCGNADDPREPNDKTTMSASKRNKPSRDINGAGLPELRDDGGELAVARSDKGIDALKYEKL